MDLRSYYIKVRDAEALLTGEYLVVVSLPTSEGGKEGVSTEVPRKIAAKLIAEGRARVATEEEAAAFHQLHQDARRQHELDEAARRVQVMVIPSRDIPTRDSLKPKDRS
jgi:hypothetical protein